MPVTEPMLMIDPPPLFFISGAAKRTMYIMDVMFRRQPLSQASTSSSVDPPGCGSSRRC